jgi:hypothetical protein
VGLQLSNYGNALKHLVPSYNGNVISGRSNSSEMVTSQMMNESEMGNRVSKSSDLSLVKEQRADGSYHQFRLLRCALMALERGYQVGILSNLVSTMNTTALRVRHYTTSTTQSLEPWFVTGFTDAEGSFMIKLSRVPTALG